MSIDAAESMTVCRFFRLRPDSIRLRSDMAVVRRSSQVRTIRPCGHPQFLGEPLGSAGLRAGASVHPEGKAHDHGLNLMLGRDATHLPDTGLAAFGLEGGKGLGGQAEGIAEGETYAPGAQIHSQYTSNEIGQRLNLMRTGISADGRTLPTGSGWPTGFGP